MTEQESLLYIIIDIIMSFTIRVFHCSRLIRRIQKKRFTTNSETLPGIDVRLLA